jgi:hypothetical protein
MGGKWRTRLRLERQIDNLFPFVSLCLFSSIKLSVQGTHTPNYAHSAPLRGRISFFVGCDRGPRPGFLCFAGESMKVLSREIIK